MAIKACVVCGAEFNALYSAKTCSAKCSEKNKKNQIQIRNNRNIEQNREKRNAYSREWKQKNKGKVSDYNKDYAQRQPRDPIKRAIARRKWLERNPDYQREYWAQLRASRLIVKQLQHGVMP